jgi:integrase
MDRGSRKAVGKRTILKYKQARDEFLAALARRRRARLDSISRTDFINYQTKLLADGLTPQTVNDRIRKVLAGPFRLAWTQGLIPANPLAGLPPLRTQQAERGTFTIDEIQRLTAAASPDWKGVILTAFYSGARLQDVCNLRWQNVDLAARAIRFIAAKTGRTVTIAIHPCLGEFLLNRPTSDDPKAFLFPTLAGKSGAGKSGLSMSFRRIMERAGVSAGLAREAKGVAGRNLSSRSFHSLRHSFNSSLANSGVSQELRRKLTGHSSDSMNSVYTHLEAETLRGAVELLPHLKL